MSNNLIKFSIIFQEDLSAGIFGGYEDLTMMYNTSLFMDDEQRKDFQIEMKNFLRDFFDAKVEINNEYF